MKENKNKLINRMIETIEQHNLIQPGDNVVVGVSGGADSVSLLLSLDSIRDQFDLDITVCHVNHKIRTETAERDQRFVEDLCESLGVKCYVKEAFVEELAKKWNMGTEEAGRKVRYDFFNEIAGKNGKIATAHNKNDNAETVMMRFMRGTGLHGLTGIPYQRGNIIRPLLDISRDEIEEFLSDLNQEYMTDETNLEPIYTRNKIRLNLIPEIQREFNPNFIDTLSNNIDLYSEEDEFMNQCAIDSIEKYFVVENEYVSMPKNILDKQHIAVVKRAVILAMQASFREALSNKTMSDIISLTKKNSGESIDIGNNVIATVEYDCIVFRKKNNIEKDMTEFNIELIDQGLGGVINAGGQVTIGYRRESAKNVENNAVVFYCPVDSFRANFTLRTKRDGDVVYVAPGIHKKLKKFFIDKKVPANDRDKYWLLVNDKNEVVWIPGLFGSRLKEDERNGQFVRFQVVG